MFKIKLIIAAVMLIGVAGVFAYIKYLQAENVVLEANNATLSYGMDAQDQTITRLEADKVLAAKQVRVKQKQLANMGRLNTELKGKLREASKEDPVVAECLGVVPSNQFIDQLREYSKGQAHNEDGAAVPE